MKKKYDIPTYEEYKDKKIVLYDRLNTKQKDKTKNKSKKELYDTAIDGYDERLYEEVGFTKYDHDLYEIYLAKQ